MKGGASALFTLVTSVTLDTPVSKALSYCLPNCKSTHIFPLTKLDLPLANNVLFYLQAVSFSNIFSYPLLLKGCVYLHLNHSDLWKKMDGASQHRVWSILDSKLTWGPSPRTKLLTNLSCSFLKNRSLRTRPCCLRPQLPLCESVKFLYAAQPANTHLITSLTFCSFKCTNWKVGIQCDHLAILAPGLCKSCLHSASPPISPHAPLSNPKSSEP